MKQSRTKLARLIAERTLQHGVSRPFDKKIAAYLLNERRINDLDSVLRDVQADWAEAGHIEVMASSAYPLAAAVKSDITKQARQLYPRAKAIIVTEVNDPSVVGGVRLKLADQQLDLTVESKLNKFKQLATAGKD